MLRASSLLVDTLDIWQNCYCGTNRFASFNNLLNPRVQDKVWVVSEYAQDDYGLHALE